MSDDRPHDDTDEERAEGPAEDPEEPDGPEDPEEPDGPGGPEASDGPEGPDEPLEEPDVKEYWRRNVRLIATLFVVWFAVSFLAAILIARPLSDVFIGNIPLSFWFAQQGSIAVFVILIFVYARQMNKLDREFGVED